MFSQIRHEYWPVRLTKVFHDLGTRDTVTERSVANPAGPSSRLVGYLALLLLGPETRSVPLRGSYARDRRIA